MNEEKRERFEKAKSRREGKGDVTMPNLYRKSLKIVLSGPNWTEGVLKVLTRIKGPMTGSWGWKD